MSGQQNSWAALPQSLRDRLKGYVFERDGYVCQLRLPGCTRRAEEPDHIIPRSLGGAVADVHNMQAACRHCNRKKGNGRRNRPSKRKGPVAGPSRDW